MSSSFQYCHHGEVLIYLFIDTRRRDRGRKKLPAALWYFGNTDAVRDLESYGALTRFAIAEINCREMTRNEDFVSERACAKQREKI